uniref:Response regulator n=1 Tax=candidate division WOR-3 bacterium TaxID=2052148 RepID=A0A7C4YCX8_UNCW3
MKRILIIDDEETIVHFLTRLINMLRCEVLSATDGEKAKEVIKSGRFDLIFLDIRIPGINSYELFNMLDDETKKKVVVFSGDTLSPEIFEFVKKNNLRLLKKPATIEEIKELIDSI